MLKLRPVAFALIMFSTASTATKIERMDSNFDIEFIEGSQLSFDVKANLSTVDNFLYENNESKKESTKAFSIKPSAFLQAHNENHLIQTFIDIESNKYDRFEQDDHTTKTVLAKYFYKLAPVHRAFISVSLDDYYEFRGQGLTKGIASTVDKGDTVVNTLVNAGYQYGRVDTVSRLNILIGKSKLEYKTREDITNIYDYEKDFALLDIDYAIAPKTELALSMEINDYTYPANPVFNNEVSYVLAGINWRPSTASELKLLFGQEQLSFESHYSDESSFKWRVNYNWFPLDYITVSFNSGRAIHTRAELGSDFYVVDNFSAIMNYRINEYFTFRLHSSYSKNRVTFEDIKRNETKVASSTGIDFKYSEKLAFNVDINYNEITSDNQLYDFDRVSLLVGTTLKF